MIDIHNFPHLLTGCQEKMKYSALGAHIKTCEKRPKIDAEPEVW